jgi:hypothetical protein
VGFEGVFPIVNTTIPIMVQDVPLMTQVVMGPALTWAGASQSAT